MGAPWRCSPSMNGRRGKTARHWTKEEREFKRKQLAVWVVGLGITAVTNLPKAFENWIALGRLIGHLLGHPFE